MRIPCAAQTGSADPFSTKAECLGIAYRKNDA
jgi:hypothetical protein